MVLLYILIGWWRLPASGSASYPETPLRCVTDSKRESRSLPAARLNNGGTGNGFGNTGSNNADNDGNGGTCGARATRAAVNETFASGAGTGNNHGNGSVESGFGNNNGNESSCGSSCRLSYSFRRSSCIILDFMLRDSSIDVPYTSAKGVDLSSPLKPNRK